MNKGGGYVSEMVLQNYLYADRIGGGPAIPGFENGGSEGVFLLGDSRSLNKRKDPVL